MMQSSTEKDQTRPCPICAAQRHRRLRGYEDAHLVRCKDCGLTFAGPRPSDEQLEDHYRGYGTAWYDSPLTRRRYNELLDTLEPYRVTNRLLDFGCGAGFFLEEAQARGWEAFGTEFGALALAIAAEKNLNVLPAPLNLGAFPPASFDVVTAFEVLEHLRDPIPEAATIAGVLRPAGIFYCTTPNFNSASRRLLKARWSSVEYPEHLSYFTARTLSDYLERVGLRRRSVISTGFSPTALHRGLSPETQRSAPGESGDERLRAAAESSRLLSTAKASTNTLLSMLRAGDTLKGRFEKVPPA